jgi:hypothetical protein
VQAGGELVGLVVELAAGVQDRHHDLKRRLALHLGIVMRLDGDAASVVDDRDRVIEVDDDVDLLAIAGHRLVDRVVDDFPDQVMEPARGR